MEQTLQYIKHRMSLRQPLQESLDILAELAEVLELNKEVDLVAELDKVRAKYPTCVDFEREFPSLCFSIATGVGKTRLMAACITYLYLKKGVRDFFILAPNLTIYDKLKKDFGDPGYGKYVFNGIAEFAQTRPIVITGENYDSVAATGKMFRNNEIRINIFNISKFNADTSEKRGTPRIKRLSEYLGESYWNYLSKLDKLVILMDEAHRYHADASYKAINELKPVLGIELTATPIDEKKNQFKNVVYEYSLAHALSDGKYVKNPAIATRKDFDPKGMDEKDLERIKLEDAVAIHRDTLNELEIYARTYDKKHVKPFILVVCKDTTHSKEIFDYVSSDAFFNGDFAGKVLQIDSKSKTEEVEQQFLRLEEEDSPIEIVIHVNMLKEGWDVTNLYTIVPLRAANAPLLIEQTIGRGLRLPFAGERTGVDKVDRLTVLAHDNFQRVIEEAQNPNSVLNKMTQLELTANDLASKGVASSVQPRFEQELAEKQEAVNAITDTKERVEQQTVVIAERAIADQIGQMASRPDMNTLYDLQKANVQQKVLDGVDSYLAGMFTPVSIETTTGEKITITHADISNAAKKIIGSTVNSFIEKTIEIPRFTLQPEEQKMWIEEFDLDTSGFRFKAMNEEILIRGLTDHKQESLEVQTGAFSRRSPQETVMLELMNYPEVNYSQDAVLLHKLIGQAIEAIKYQLDDLSKLPIIIRQYHKLIAERIYKQIQTHLRLSELVYREPEVLPFTKLEPLNITEDPSMFRDYHDERYKASQIRDYVFGGFKKSCHERYKFDSSSEKTFAGILEEDSYVQKWLRPADRQFRIYWGYGSRQYRPDFVVETDDTIYLIEVKSGREVDSEEVQSKCEAALQYCRHATNFTQKHGGKPWRYMLVPHTDIQANSTFKKLAAMYSK